MSPVKKILALIEVGSLIACGYFVCKWIASKDGIYEPWFSLFGLTGVALDLIRRYAFREGEESFKDTVDAHVDWLLCHSIIADLSVSLPRALRLARQVGDAEFARWCLFEIHGWHKGMREEEFVPEYRTITGRYVDDYGRLLHISDPELLYANTDRVRHGVAELEAFAKKTETLQIYDEQGFSLISRYFNFQPARFLVDPSSFVGVIGLIKSELYNRVLMVKDSRHPPRYAADE